MSKKQVAAYILERRIGKGSYATVWKGRVEGTDEAVAVKVISRQTVTETAQLRQEVEVLRRISHANIVRFRDLKKSAAHFYLVLEYCAGGDLSQFLREHGRVAEEKARRFLTQIAAGLCMLHRENVLHRDLKPQNILLSDNSDDPALKIADFGFARALQPQDMAATVCGSPLYMAPEILRHEPYDAKADLWSVGAILFELLLGRTPFSGANPMQLLANIEKTDRVSFDGVQVSSEGQDFLWALLMRSPGQRLSSVEFARHSYVCLGDPNEDMQRSTEGVVYGNEGGSLVVPCEWCVPSEELQAAAAGGAVSPVSGVASPVVASPTGGRSPEATPRGNSQNCDESPKFEMAGDAVLCSGLMSPQPSAAATGGGYRAGAEVPEPSRAPQPAASLTACVLPEEVAPTLLASSSASSPSPQLSMGRSSPPPPCIDTLGAGEDTGLAGRSTRDSGRAAGAQSTGGTTASAGSSAAAALPPPALPDRTGGGMEEEYVVVTAQQPVSAWARRGPTPRAAANGFCANLARIAGTLEQLAKRLHDSPLEALALLCRALGLLEKALNVSVAEEEASEPLRQSFQRMLEAAEAAAQQVRASSQLPCGAESWQPPARPNRILFEFAVQQAKDAAVALSKGHEVGGWEAPCHERLTLALLLLDLLGSEADGEDLEAIRSYTAPIAKIIAGIERLGRPLSRSAGAPTPPPLQPVGC